MAEKKTYVLKSDRSKKVLVLMPMFGLVNYTDGDGKKQMMDRNDFNALYEPEIAPVDTSNVGTLAPGGKKAGATLPTDDDRLARIEKGLGIVMQRVNTVSDQVDAIHSVVVAQPDKANTKG
jgi:hypothetical protein